MQKDQPEQVLAGSAGNGSASLGTGATGKNCSIVMMAERKRQCF